MARVLRTKSELAYRLTRACHAIVAYLILEYDDDFRKSWYRCKSTREIAGPNLSRNIAHRSTDYETL